MFPLYDELRSQTIPWVTRVLIIINILVFIYQFSLPEQALIRFVDGADFVPADLMQHPIQAVSGMFSSMFVHGDIWHLVGNMWFLWVFGDNVEDTLGHGTFITFYALGGVGAALSQAFFGGDPTVGMIGASGAISAVLGAYLVFHPAARIRTLIFIFLVRVPAFVFLPYWAWVQYVSLGAQDAGVAFAAHFGGFVVGMVLAWVLPKQYSPARNI